MDAAGAEALRVYIEERNGGQMPDAARLPVTGTALAALERWFKVRDEHAEDHLSHPDAA
jgi:hypothetical protein